MANNQHLVFFKQSKTSIPKTYPVQISPNCVKKLRQDTTTIPLNLLSVVPHSHSLITRYWDPPNQKSLFPKASNPKINWHDLKQEIEIYSFKVSEFFATVSPNLIKKETKQKSRKYSHPIEFIVQPPLDIQADSNLHLPLWPTQISGVEFLLNKGCALLADDPGLGKTVQAIVALRLLFRKGVVRRALIVCPKSTIGDKRAAIENGDARQWEGHLELWAPELLVQTILPATWEGGIPPPGFSGSSSLDRAKEWMTPAHVYLTTYALARNDIKNKAIPLNYFDAIILDEAHNIKNPNSQQSIALRSLSGEYRWGLTGTPVQNYPSELYAICQFLKPSTFTNLRPKEFSNLSETFVSALAAPLIIRREKASEDLPPKIHEDHWVELTSAQRIEYDEIYESRRRRIMELTQFGRPDRETKTSILGAIQKLKQICNFSSPGLSSNKMSIISDILQSALSEERKVLVFSQYLARGIVPISRNIMEFEPLIISGDVSHLERQARIEEFKTKNNRNILILSLRAASEGLNLQEASVVIHFDHWWNPAVQWQAEGRAHRHGQKQTVNVHSLRVRNTIDEKIFKMLKKKSEVIERMMNELSAGQAITEISRAVGIEDLLELFEL